MSVVDSKQAATFSINLESPIKAVALNRDGSQVVAAGRNLLRIFSIGDDRFTEKENLRFSKRSNLNCADTAGWNPAITDIAWNPIDENLLASSTTTGAVCIWNLSMTTPVKQEQVYLKHRRTANRVCFHPQDFWCLLSGSQDATAIIFDIRTADSCSTFRCEEAVRDVRFNPHNVVQFAVCLENGNVQLFDSRRSDLCEREFTCHTGPVFQSDFHPTEKHLLATCGRDKCIKVWNLLENKNPSLEYLVPTIAPMGCIAWRPNRKTFLASTALVTDFSVSVFDLTRPYIPFASFEKHTDLVTSLIWRQDPRILLAGSKDGFLSQFSFKDAKRPADKVNPVGLDLGCYGDVVQACSQRIIDGHGTRLLQNIFTKGVGPDKEFQLNATSKLSFYDHNDLKCLSMDWFVSSAKEYMLCGRPVAELCNHNALVAENVGRSQVAQVWRIMAFLYGSDNRTEKSRHGTTDSKGGHRFIDGKREEIIHSRSDDFSSFNDGAYDPVFNRDRSSRSTAKEPISLATEPPSSNTGDFLFNEQTVFEEVDTPYTTGIDLAVEEESWQLPAEGFQLRHELPDRSHLHHVDGIVGKATAADINRNRNRSGSVAPDDFYDDALRLGSLMTQLNRGPLLDFGDLIRDTIFYHADQADVQTTVSLLLVLGDRTKGMFTETLLEAWMLDYIDLLTHYQLYTVANDVIKLCHVPAVAELNQQSTMIGTSCNSCSKHLHKVGWYCTSCRKLTNVCSICQLPVRGLYAWCQGCAHGGHLEHIQDWLKKSPQCPTGCGHLCEYI